MTEPITWGILGCARIARKALIPGILATPGARLVGLASRDYKKAQSWAGEFGIPKAFGSYEELLADREIQAMYIPLPNELHCPWTIRAAQAGKHVLCDKPLGLNSTEAQDMVEACARARVVLMEGFMWRHHPRTNLVEKMVRRADIGELRLIRCSFSFNIDPSDWRLDPARGGGSLWDIGCYGVNTCRLFAGSEPLAIQAAAHRGPSGVDMTLTAMLQFPGDILGQVDCSFEAPFRCTYELVGTRGAISVPRAYLPDDNPQVIFDHDGTVESIAAPVAHQYRCMVEHFNAAVRRGGTLSSPAEDGLCNMRVLDAIRAAAR